MNTNSPTDQEAKQRREDDIATIRFLYGISDNKIAQRSINSALEKLGYGAFSDAGLAEIAKAQERYEARITSEFFQRAS